MSRGRILIVLALVVAIAAAWWYRSRPRVIAEAYVGERNATLWSSLAQVRQPVAALHYGEKVSILERRGEQINVRTAQGARGWLDARLLMEPGLWQRSVKLLTQANAMPVQARGRTKVPCNLRLEPGRSASRLYQFPRGTPVEVLSREVAEWSPPSDESPASAKEPEEETKTRREDWLLVRGSASSSESAGRGDVLASSDKADESVPLAGWVLARFIEFNLPGPVRDLASSSGMHVVAWFELNRVAGPDGEKPQYLSAGHHGGNGQPCDFTLIRVYTWGGRRKRYETAYVESNLCGKLPIRTGKNAAGDPEFRFSAAGLAGNEERRYQMHQTVVHRVREAEGAAAKRPKQSR